MLLISKLEIQFTNCIKAKQISFVMVLYLEFQTYYEESYGYSKKNIADPPHAPLMIDDTNRSNIIFDRYHCQIETKNHRWFDHGITSFENSIPTQNWILY